MNLMKELKDCIWIEYEDEQFVKVLFWDFKNHRPYTKVFDYSKCDRFKLHKIYEVNRKKYLDNMRKNYGDNLEQEKRVMREYYMEEYGINLLTLKKDIVDIYMFLRNKVSYTLKTVDFKFNNDALDMKYNHDEEFQKVYLKDIPDDPFAVVKLNLGGSVKVKYNLYCSNPDPELDKLLEEMI